MKSGRNVEDGNGNAGRRIVENEKKKENVGCRIVERLSKEEFTNLWAFSQTCGIYLAALPLKTVQFLEEHGRGGNVDFRMVESRRKVEHEGGGNVGCQIVENERKVEHEGENVGCRIVESGRNTEHEGE
ncbi:Hypothetical predicted protein [Olea europaea subsp. europaea]|uniref:Uncharacterized protein n=1 Tax=Olea europaea subsp. europaea TaxID=158383 RepID=A0A8S0TGA6_OLEEU|nr:Hypothetical predicted protein [Olea europaea subsp. europaea]